MILNIELSDELLAMDFVSLKEQIIEDIFQELLDKVVQNPHLQFVQIRFSKNGLKHGIYRKPSQEKLLLVSHLPALIASATLVRKEAQKKDKNREAFILEAKIKVNDLLKKYRIVLKQNPNGTFYYDHYEWIN